MAFLNDEVIHQVRSILEGLTHEVELKVYTGSDLVVPGRDATGHQRETLGLLRELEALSDKLTVTETPLSGDEEARTLGIERAPTILFRRKGESRSNLRYAGLPSGYEFTLLLDAIRMVSEHETAAPGDDPVGDLAQPVLLQTFVTPTCPHCPRALLTAFELALGNDAIVAEGIEANEFPVISGRFRISSVPDTIVDGRRDRRVLGAQPKRQFVEAIVAAAGVAGSTGVAG